VAESGNAFYAKANTEAAAAYESVLKTTNFIRVIFNLGNAYYKQSSSACYL
jgi:hypothetical protein